MGLDTYSTIPDLDYTGIELCGGMMSSNGAGSFRGKVYSDFIEHVTGVSLYEEVITNDVIHNMAKQLDTWVLDNVEEQTCFTNGIDGSKVTWEEAYMLAKWFKVTAEGGADVTGWW
ncbi:MAG: hypothetical protein H8E12_06285 [Rhodobacteraceae bacterium]|nr:hypothetical protein [Paracoccaceae bacterium]